jgi:60 kDa SS-A/Ro ribonucleoprotein
MESGVVGGVRGLTPRIASAAMALITAASEPHRQIIAFAHQMQPLDIRPGQRLDEVIRTIRKIPFGGTDCALPMIWAQQRKLQVDAFVVYTDSETWAGKIHPAQALRDYRRLMRIPAKLVVVGMVANRVTIADPNDAGMLDVVGFDAAAPQVIGDFITAGAAIA